MLLWLKNCQAWWTIGARLRASVARARGSISDRQRPGRRGEWFERAQARPHNELAKRRVLLRLRGDSGEGGVATETPAAPALAVAPALAAVPLPAPHSPLPFRSPLPQRSPSGRARSGQMREIRIAPEPVPAPVREPGRARSPCPLRSVVGSGSRLSPCPLQSRRSDRARARAGPGRGEIRSRPSLRPLRSRRFDRTRATAGRSARPVGRSDPRAALPPPWLPPAGSTPRPAYRRDRAPGRGAGRPREHDRGAPARV